MEVKILRDALKHGVSEKSILHCLNKYRYDCSMVLEEFEGGKVQKRVIAGFDSNANPIEVIEIEEGEKITVIHAMSLRPQYFDLLQGTIYGK